MVGLLLMEATMKKFYLFVAIYLVLTFSVIAQESYENDTVEVISDFPSVEQPIAPITIKSTALDPSKFYFSISLEPSGFLAGGPSATAEFSKGAFNSLVHVSFPTLALLNNNSKGFGFGLGASFNYFWNGRIGGFYLGGLLEWTMFPVLKTFYHPYYTYNPATDNYSGQYVTEKIRLNNFIFALNAGYKFITKAGVYFRTGVSAGMALSNDFSTNDKSFGFYYRPDIAIGYIF
jgi:hypothetical protein